MFKMKLVHIKIEHLVHCLCLWIEYKLPDRGDYFAQYVHYWNLSTHNSVWRAAVLNKFVK